MPLTMSDLETRKGLLQEQLREQEDIVNAAMAKLHALQGAVELISGMINAEQQSIAYQLQTLPTPSLKRKEQAQP